MPRGGSGRGRAVPAGSAGLRHVSDEPRGFRAVTAAGSPAGPRLASGGAGGAGRDGTGRRGARGLGGGCAAVSVRGCPEAGAGGVFNSALPGCGGTSGAAAAP